MQGRDSARHQTGLAMEEEQRLVLILHTKQGINIIRLMKFPRKGLERIMLEIKVYVCVCVGRMCVGGVDYMKIQPRYA